MTEAQKQATQRFVAALIAELVTLAVAALSSPELVQLIAVWAGEGSVVTTLLLTLLPPLALALGKLAAGPTVKTPASADDVRGGRGVTTGESPGLFG